MMGLRKLLTAFIFFLLLAAGRTLGREGPLANEDLRGLYARSIEQVLRLDESEIDLATAVLIISEQWNDNVYGRRYVSKLDDMAYEIRRRLITKKRRPKYYAVEVINKYLFDEMGFDSIAEASNPDDLFLHSVIDSKRGYCLSLSMLYLALGERLGVPLYGVVVPGHFFVRYDDGHTRFNIETTSRGGTADDDHYINKFNVPDADRGTIYLNSLNKKQSLGCFFNNLGNSYFDVGNLDSALVALKRATEINPSLAESRTNLGNVYLKLGQIDDAIYQYQKSLDINPHDAKTYNNLGNAYTKNRLHNDAIGCYEKALELDDDFVDVYINLSAAYSQIKMHGKALALLRDAIALEPRNNTLHSQIGNIYAETERFDKAIEYFKRALKIGPATAEIHYGLAICYNRLDRADDEIKEYKKALAIDPYMTAALVNLGNVYFNRKDYNEALELYQKAVRLEPENHNSHYNLAAAYFNKGNYTLAAQEYSRVVEIEPKTADAHKGLGYSLYNLKEYEKAWRYLRIAQELGAEIDHDLLDAIEAEL